jgi:P-type E1-E2 ATPase
LKKATELRYGIKVQLEQKNVCIGCARFMLREGLALPEQLVDFQKKAEEQGHSLVYVGIDHELAGILEMQPSIRPEAHQLIEHLKQRGLTTYIISGDHKEPTRNIFGFKQKILYKIDQIQTWQIDGDLRQK